MEEKETQMGRSRGTHIIGNRIMPLHNKRIALIVTQYNSSYIPSLSFENEMFISVLNDL